DAFVADAEQEVDRLSEQLWLERADECPFSVPALENVQGDESPDRLSKGRSAETELEGEIAFRRQAMSWREFPVDNHRLDDVHRLVRDSGSLDKWEFTHERFGHAVILSRPAAFFETCRSG